MMPLVRIEGRGPIAAALRLFLLEQGFDAAQIDGEQANDALPDWLASRAIALSAGSLELLSRSVAALDPRRLRPGDAQAAAIMSVAILRAGSLGRSLIEPDPQGPGCLGAVIRYGILHRLLSDAWALQSHVSAVGRSAQGEAGRRPDGEGETRNAPATALVQVIADGEPRTGERNDLDQYALTAEVQVGRGEPGRAWERFTAEGPLALLPLPGAGRYALVWCAPPQIAQRRADLPAQTFEGELLQAFGPALGPITLASPRHCAPVRRQQGPVRIDRWTVAIGNAAQTLHPVAGQGLNLGLRDAWVLARCLGDALAQSRRRQPAHGVSDSAREPSAIGHEDFGNALDRHEMLRRHDRRSMVAITDTLASLTRAQAMLPLQSLALAGLELCTALKRRARTTFTHGWREL